MTTRLALCLLLVLAACSWTVKDTRPVPPLPEVVPDMVPERSLMPTITPTPDKETR